MKKEERKMIIIGSSNNYNELGLVRSFGVNGIRPYGIIVCSKKMWIRDWLHRSKYWKKCYRVDSGEEAITLLVKVFGNEKIKPCVTTPVDYIVQIIDSKYKSLSNNFILQSIQEEQGKIQFYSNKLNQTELTKQMGFLSLPTQIIDFSSGENNIDVPFAFPVLLKPAVCGEGKKDDIVICRNNEEYYNELKILREKRYLRILCQKYLENRTELLAFGAISHKYNFYSYTVLKNIRQWPPIYGVGCYGKLTDNKKIIKFVDEFYKAIMKFGYDGPIDTEIFIDNNTGKLYINEYNWRAGGRNFTSLGTKIYSIVLWYWLHNGQDISRYKYANTCKGYTMNEAIDFNYVINGKISIKEWKKEYHNSIAHSIVDKKDIKPMLIVIFSLLKKYMLSRGKNGRKK